MSFINNLAAGVGYFTIGLTVIWVMVCGVEYVATHIEQLRYKNIENRFLQQLLQVDRYCCNDFPDVAFAMQQIIQNWRNGAQVDASLLRDRLKRSKEGAE